MLAVLYGSLHRAAYLIAVYPHDVKVVASSDFFYPGEDILVVNAKTIRYGTSNGVNYALVDMWGADLEYIDYFDTLFVNENVMFNSNPAFAKKLTIEDLAEKDITLHIQKNANTYKLVHIETKYNRWGKVYIEVIRGKDEKKRRIL